MSLQKLECSILVCDAPECEVVYETGEYTPHFGDDVHHQNEVGLIRDYLDGTDWQTLYRVGQPDEHRCGKHRTPCDWCGYCGDEIAKYALHMDDAPVWRHESSGLEACVSIEPHVATPEDEMPEVLEPGVPS